MAALERWPALAPNGDLGYLKTSRHLVCPGLVCSINREAQGSAYLSRSQVARDHEARRLIAQVTVWAVLPVSHVCAGLRSAVLLF